MERTQFNHRVKYWFDVKYNKAEIIFPREVEVKFLTGG